MSTQPSIALLSSRSLERMQASPIRGTTQLLGLIGDPVSHSLSPAMHNAALAHMGIDAVYLPFPVKSADVKQALAGLQSIAVLGLSVTIPHKQAVLPFLTEVAETARIVGAVNTLYPLARGGWGGTNTDVSGFIHPLNPIDRDWNRATALILGSGGAARAVIQGCYELGFERVVVVGRSPEKLAALRSTWSGLQTVSWKDLPHWLPKSLLVVNATPLGMHSELKADAAIASPLSKEQLEQLPKSAIVYDLVYIPQPTQFLKLAKSLGLFTIDGLEMLVQQGAIALSLWLGGREVPVEVMRQAAMSHLGLT